MSDETPTAPLETPIEPLFTHPASPFIRTQPPGQAAFPSPPSPDGFAAVAPAGTWSTYKTQIQFGFAILAYLMVLVGCVTVVSANRSSAWVAWVAVLPALPAAVLVWLTVRQLGRLDELQKRTQMQAIGCSVAGTGLVTFGYGFLEGAGMPDVSPAFVLPMLVGFWALGLLLLALRQRLRR